jgi:hypothetical protein
MSQIVRRCWRIGGLLTMDAWFLPRRGWHMMLRLDYTEPSRSECLTLVRTEEIGESE